MNAIQTIEAADLKDTLPQLTPGDTVRVHVKVKETSVKEEIKGKPKETVRERVQVFEGVVISRRGGARSETFTVRKISYGVGVERIFPTESPAVTRVEIKARGHVRRSRLYYLRGRTGKKARLRSKVRDLSGLISEEERDAAGTAAEALAEPALAAEAVAEEVAAVEETAVESEPEAPDAAEDETAKDA